MICILQVSFREASSHTTQRSTEGPEAPGWGPYCDITNSLVFYGLQSFHFTLIGTCFSWGNDSFTNITSRRLSLINLKILITLSCCNIWIDGSIWSLIPQGMLIKRSTLDHKTNSQKQLRNMYSEIMLSEECTKLDITIKMNQLKIKTKMKSFRVKKKKFRMEIYF